MTISTHVLDATTGRPAAGVHVTLESRDGASWVPAADGVTDADGRIRELGEPGVGVHRIGFDTGAYFGGATFYPEVNVVFEIVDAGAHHHVPLLLSPYAYSTYRGS
jgi:5-hydroxyisourate hydrolase